MKALVWLVAVGLFGLVACTKAGYVKPSVTEQEVFADTEACAEIAHRQALHDYAVFRFRARFNRNCRCDRHFSDFHDFWPNLSDLEFRYRRICLISKGYELAPLDEEPSS